MPYNRNDELPEAVRSALPTAAQTIFRNVVNSVLDDGGDEQSAFRQAWGAVKQRYEQNEQGKWVRKRVERKKAVDGTKTLYVSRKVLNADDLIAWAKDQGFKKVLQPSDMHVTLAFSRKAVDWSSLEADTNKLTFGHKTKGDSREVKPLGDKGAVVLSFESDALTARHEEFGKAGASWDYEGYHPHITLTYDTEGVDLDKVEPYAGRIQLGPEEFAEVSEEWSEGIELMQILKVDSEQQMVYGWASVISKGGKPVVDSQGDIIEAGELVKATTEFMVDARKAKAMHEGGKIGEVLHSFPLTKELAASLGIQSDLEGWIVGVKIHSEDVWKQVKDGTLRAFSIGGFGSREDVDDSGEGQYAYAA